MNEQIYWIWLQQALGYGNYRVKTVFELYPNIKEFYNSGEYGWRICGCFNNQQIETLKSTSLDIAYNIFRKCEILGYKIFSLADENFPFLLKEIPDPPAVIYTLGNDKFLNSTIPISIVGARDATFHGLKIAEEMAYKLANSGAMIISGGALGIDSAAHKGALNAAKGTIAVLGCGINSNYLSSNSYLRKNIAQSGILISEYPPDYPANSYNFPKRNRIISGLSLATIVVEAGKRSGSLITANLANEQNRDVFVAMTDLSSPSSKGVVSLINDGAKVLCDPLALVKDYKTKFNKNSFKNETTDFDSTQKTKVEKVEKVEKFEDDANISHVSENAKKVYNILKSSKMDADNICKNSKMKINDILSALTELEICGLIKNTVGREYEITD